jgi:DNA-binding response OmpR family regulator
MRVLVVEDEPGQNAALCAVLKKFRNYDVVSATDGVDMLEALQTGAVDLVITDLNMPNLNGVDATKFVRKQLHLKVPIIGVTGLQKGDPLLKSSIGVFEFLVHKPIHMDELFDDIDTLREEVRGRNDEEGYCS